MTDGGLSLDHVGFMVRDLDAGEKRWRDLGFQLAARSPQMGATPDGAVMAPWATANHCAMFERGYLELIGITDPTKHNPWTAFLDRFEGIHITAFRCPGADAAYAALAQRIDGFGHGYFVVADESHEIGQVVVQQGPMHHADGLVDAAR